jgi:hypothetical protein
MIEFYKKNFIIILLTSLGVLFYFLIFYQIGSFENLKFSLYATGDSREYGEYADWLRGRTTYFNAYRTYFFPLIILISRAIWGYYGIWIIQFIFWISACILIYRTVMRFSGNQLLACISFLVATTNVSLIVYTTHALTEISTFFFLSLFAFSLSYIRIEEKNIKNIIPAIFIISVLTTLRPVFQIYWYLMILIALICNLKSYTRKPILFLALVAALIPTLVQLSINKINDGTFSNTKIAEHNLRYYMYKEVRYNEEMTGKIPYNDLPDSIHRQLKIQASKIEKQEIVNYLLHHPKKTISVFLSHIRENLTRGNPYIDRNKNYELSKWVENTNNNFIFYLHIIFLIIWIYYIIKHFKSFPKNYLGIFSGGILLFYILISSGIANWSGDRLVVYTVAIWAVLYPVLIYDLITSKNRNHNNMKTGTKARSPAIIRVASIG